MKVLVTGAYGFLGKSLIPKIPSIHEVLTPTKEQMDLTCIVSTEQYLSKNHTSTAPIDVILHLAGYNGGIVFNRAYPADIFAINTQMNANLLLTAAKMGVGRIVSALASCAYAPSAENLPEENFLEGQPHPSVACHGLAKRHLYQLSQFVSSQYHTRTLCLCMPNLFGENMPITFEKSKFVGGLMEKFYKAKEDKVASLQLFGTGTSYRELLHANDAADMFLRASGFGIYPMCSYPLLNLPGKEVYLKTIIKAIQIISGFEGELIWGSPDDDGQFRKKLCHKRYQFLYPGVLNYEQLSLDETVIYIKPTWDALYGK